MAEAVARRRAASSIDVHAGIDFESMIEPDDAGS
jgi:hypothetical protein